MRILFLTELFYPHGSGAEFATYLYSRLLREEDIDVVVLTNRFPGEPFFFEEGSLQIYRVPLFKNAGSVKYSILERFDIIASSLFKRLLNWADVVYVPRFWFTAIAWAKAHGKPVIVHMHDYISVCALSTLFNETESKVCVNKGVVCSPECVYSFEKAHGRTLVQTIKSMVLNSTLGRYLPKTAFLADAVVCVSAKQKELIIDRAGSLRDKTYVIYNPFPRYSDFRLTGDDFGYFGGPDVLKGFKVLFEAVSQINTNKIRVKIHCTKFPKFSPKIMREIGRFGFSLYKRLETSELEQLYHKLRSIIVPSVWNEPWPYVVVEALIRGRFVIASRIGGIPEQLEGCKGAILCKPGSSKNLAEAINHVHNLRRDEIIDLGCQNRETFLSRFNNDYSVRKFINVCEHLT